MNTLAETEQTPLTAPVGSSPKIHLGYLDSLRALAACHVVMVHALTQVDRYGTTLPAYVQWFHNYCCYGHQAVGLFIVLSGFCLMLPVVKGDGTLRGGAWNFFKKRARRILPTYYLALAVCLLLIWTFMGQKTGTAWDIALPVTTKDIVMHLLMLQDISAGTGGKIDYSLWTVSVEWRIYFVFPLLVLGWQRFGALKTTFAAVVIGYLLLVLLRPTPIYTMTDGVTPEYLGLFAMGMLGAGITFSRSGVLAQVRHRTPWILVVLATTALLVFLSHAKLLHGKVLQVSMLDFFVGIWAMSLLVASGYKAETRLHHALSWKPLAFVGTFAYSIYVIHAPLLELIWRFVVKPLHLSHNLLFLSIFVIFVPLVVALSYLFFLACERPFLTRRVVLDAK